MINHCFTEEYENDEWELYHVETDYSEKYNVAEQYPEKLQELKEDFMHEAGKYGVFPMLRFPMHGKPENLGRQYGERMEFPEKVLEFRHIIKPVNLVAARNVIVQSVSHVLTAEIHRDSELEDGVVYSNGQRFGGISFYIKDNKLKYYYNANTADGYLAESQIEIPVGDVSVGYSFIRGIKSAHVTLYINHVPVGEAEIERLAYMVGFSSSIGDNKYSPVSPEYEVPFAFQGRIEYLKIHQFAASADPREELAKLLSVE